MEIVCSLFMQYLDRIKETIINLSFEDWCTGFEYAAYIYLAVLSLRFVWVFLGRIFGFYAPSQYRWFPRLPWRPLFKFITAISDWRERTFLLGKRGATGGFSSALETFTLLYKPGQVHLGRAYAWGVPLYQPIGSNVIRHMFAFAMTGAGKTTALISILACWVGSAFVIDPKGQITRALSRLFKGRWLTLDPYGITGLKSVTFNPFDVIKWAMKRNGEGAAVLWGFRIAESLIITSPSSRSPFFTDTYRGFIAGVILHILTAHPKGEHNLPFLRDLIKGGYRIFNEDGNEETTSEEAQLLLLREMRNNPAFDGVISGAAAAMENASGETGGNVRATGLEQTKWLDIPAVREVLKTSSFDLSELKTHDDIVFSFVAPVLSIREELAPFSRLLTNLTIYVFEAEKKKKGQCLMMVDELPSLGYNAIFEVALAVFRSYGITFFGIAQDTEILKKSYPQSWEGFIGNADIVWWMGSNHEATTAYLSKFLGRKSIVEKDLYSRRKNYREIDVMSSDQVRRFLYPESGRMIVTLAGKRALKFVNDPYYKLFPVWKYHPDPDHRESLPRWLMRKLIRSISLMGRR